MKRNKRRVSSRPEIHDTIHALKTMGVKHITMLTGDNQQVAASVAQTIDLPGNRLHHCGTKFDTSSFHKTEKENHGFGMIQERGTDR